MTSGFGRVPVLDVDFNKNVLDVKMMGPGDNYVRLPRKTMVAVLN